MKRNKVILDFDGIFASNMIYTSEGKTGKTFSWGIRHSIDMLVDNGFEVIIITGDSTKEGQAITKKFCENLKISDIVFCNSTKKLSYLKTRYNLNECYYSGDDIYDVELFQNMYGITHKNSHCVIKDKARYVSDNTPNDYYFMDMALYILGLKYSRNKEYIAEMIAMDCHKESMSDALMDLRYKNIYILQQYSMRNHSDNKYNPLLDGNLNLTFNRIYNAVHHNPELKVTITIPTNVNENQYSDLKKFVIQAFGEDRIFFEEIEYGLNAPDNFEKFSKLYFIDKKYDLFISSFASECYNYDSADRVKTIYSFNISKVDGMDREYIDKFYEWQEAIVQHSCLNKNRIYVLNENQKDQFIKTLGEFNELTVKQMVIVDSHLVNIKFLEQQMNFFNTIDFDELKRIHKYLKNSSRDKNIFFPFRLSDKCYEFEFLLSKILESKDKYNLFITDPNDSINEFEIPENIMVWNLKNFDCDPKSIYFIMLLICQQTQYNISIPVFENPLNVMHQTILEMVHLTNNVKFLNKDDFDIETLYDFEDITGIKEQVKTLIK